MRIVGRRMRGALSVESPGSGAARHAPDDRSASASPASRRCSSRPPGLDLSGVVVLDAFAGSVAPWASKRVSSRRGARRTFVGRRPSRGRARPLARPKRSAARGRLQGVHACASSLATPCAHRRAGEDPRGAGPLRASSCSTRPTPVEAARVASVFVAALADQRPARRRAAVVVYEHAKRERRHRRRGPAAFQVEEPGATTVDLMIADPEGIRNR